jgi:hypothetical protein
MIQIERDFIYVSLSSEQAQKLNATWNQKRKAYKVPNTIGALRELHGLGFDVAEYGTQKRMMMLQGMKGYDLIKGLMLIFSLGYLLQLSFQK